MANKDIRRAMFEKEIRQWELAKMLNVSEAQVSRMLRSELPDEKKAQILSVIEDNEAENEAP